MGSIADPRFVSRIIGERLMTKGLVTRAIVLKRVRNCTAVNDSAFVYVLPGKRGFAVHISPHGFPDVVANEWCKINEMRSILGRLGTPIMCPIDSGKVLGLTYAVTPYRRRLSQSGMIGRLDEMRVKPALLGWLLGVASECAANIGTTTYERAFEALGAVVNPESLSAGLLRSCAPRLSSGPFVALGVPMHGDLWKGNVLRGEGSVPFTLIDWRGSLARGFPIVDLILAARSFHMSSAQLRRELELHLRVLGSEPADLPLYLLGGLGHRAANLGEMPMTQFREAADDCVAKLAACRI